MNTVCASTSQSKDINLDIFVTYWKMHIMACSHYVKAKIDPQGILSDIQRHVDT